MADYHVLNINDRKDTARVVFHFATPAGNNSAGVSYATALVEWKAPASEVSSAADAADVAAGTVIEHVETVEFNAHATNQQKQAVIEARWTALNAVIPTRIQENLRFWGFEGDVT